MGIPGRVGLRRQVEEVSRAVEYLQLVAAAAVDRTRKQSAAAATGAAAGAVTAWTTGWRETPPGGRPAHPEPRTAGAAGPAGTSLSSAALRHVCCGGSRQTPGTA